DSDGRPRVFGCSDASAGGDTPGPGASVALRRAPVPPPAAVSDPAILDTDIEQLPGVGPRRAEPLRKAGIKTFRDLFRTYPRRYLDRSTVVPIRQLAAGGEAVTVVGWVKAKGMI